jgi:hypothetical protein
MGRSRCSTKAPNWVNPTANILDDDLHSTEEPSQQEFNLMNYLGSFNPLTLEENSDENGNGQTDEAGESSNRIRRSSSRRTRSCSRIVDNTTKWTPIELSQHSVELDIEMLYPFKSYVPNELRSILCTNVFTIEQKPFVRDFREVLDLATPILSNSATKAQTSYSFKALSQGGVGPVVNYQVQTAGETTGDIEIYNMKPKLTSGQILLIIFSPFILGAAIIIIAVIIMIVKK